MPTIKSSNFYTFSYIHLAKHMLLHNVLTPDLRHIVQIAYYVHLYRVLCKSIYVQSQCRTGAQQDIAPAGAITPNRSPHYSKFVIKYYQMRTFCEGPSIFIYNTASSIRLKVLVILCLVRYSYSRN